MCAQFYLELFWFLRCLKKLSLQHVTIGVLPRFSGVDVEVMNFKTLTLSRTEKHFREFSEVCLITDHVVTSLISRNRSNAVYTTNNKKIPRNWRPSLPWLQVSRSWITWACENINKEINRSSCSSCEGLSTTWSNCYDVSSCFQRSFINECFDFLERLCDFLKKLSRSRFYSKPLKAHRSNSKPIAQTKSTSSCVVRHLSYGTVGHLSTVIVNHVSLSLETAKKNFHFIISTDVFRVASRFFAPSYFCRVWREYGNENKKKRHPQVMFVIIAR